MKKIVKFVLIVGGIAFVAKLVSGKKSEWRGLTESEVRDKLESRLPKWVPGEKRAEIADEVVAGMRGRGALRDDEEPSVGAPSDSSRGGEEPDSGDAEASDVSDDATASA